MMAPNPVPAHAPGPATARLSAPVQVPEPVRFPDLERKVAVVTGGSRGIGAATCRYLAASGVRVAAVGRDEAALASVVADVRADGGTAIGVVADCTDPAALGGLRDRVERELDEVDIVAAFAGGDGHPGPTIGMTPDRWREILDNDLTSAFLTIQTFLPAMVDRGRGSIITMSSASGRAASRANIGYAVAKAGIVMLTRHLAAEVAGSGVRVNCVAPSAIRNEWLTRTLDADGLRRLGESFPLRRIGEPDDVAAATAYLASAASSWITGVTIDISGGKVMP
jgi:3-oxoacyl-[acyl-carrier protein] reductase